MSKHIRIIYALLFILFLSTLIIPPAHAFTFSGHLEKSGTQSYGFQLSDDGTVYVTVTYDGDLNPFTLSIRAPDDTCIYQELLGFDASGTTYGPFLLQAGSYLLVIRGSAYTNEGDYTLSGDVTPASYPNDEEPNDNIAEAQSFSYLVLLQFS
jgi:hypothetical protein